MPVSVMVCYMRRCRVALYILGVVRYRLEIENRVGFEVVGYGMIGASDFVL